ncbi:MAG: hypothetical protein V1818_03905 [Candidatus Aenigmatarchaeota archaeon]
MNKSMFDIGIAMIVIAAISIFVYVVFFSNIISPPVPEIIVTNSGGSAMLAAECADKSYLYDNADIVVIGTVSKVETKQENQIYTYSSILVESFEKGELNSNKLKIKTPGGCIGTTCMQVEDQPIFHEDELVRIYLKQDENEFSIICGIAGVEEVGRI